MKNIAKAALELVFAATAGLCCVLLSGCTIATTATAGPEAGAAIKGNVHGGQQAIVGAHVYLLAASTSNYGAASTSLLTTGIAGTDTVGGYVLSDANGAFSISNDYTCTPGTQVFLYAQGGNPGNGVNSAASLLAALGQCPSAGNFYTGDSTTGAIPFVAINEVSTVTTAFALVGFASDAHHIGSQMTPQSLLGIKTAFANVPQLENLATGATFGSTPLGNGTVPRQLINTLANIIAACINSAGPSSTPCSTLFATARYGGATGVIANETATAAIYMARHPGNGVTTLFNLATAQDPFAPALPSAPNDFTIGIKYTGFGMQGPSGVAVDSTGNVWVSNGSGYTISEFSNTGTQISPFGGYQGNGDIFSPTAIAIDASDNAWFTSYVYSQLNELTGTGFAPDASTGGGMRDPTGLAFDANGNVWVSNYFTRLSEFYSYGAAESPSAGYTGGGLSASSGVAIDPTNGVWIPNKTNNNLSLFSLAGVPLSSTGFTGGGLSNPSAIALDGNGDPWITNNNGTSSSISEFNRSGTAMSGSTGYTGGGLNGPVAIAIDGFGNVWAVNGAGNSLSEFSSTGTAMSPATTGYSAGQLNGPTGITIDFAGSVWISNATNNSVTQLIGLAAPTVTPLSLAVKNFSVGTRP
jgi:streptogramin lyase